MTTTRKPKIPKPDVLPPSATPEAPADAAAGTEAVGAAPEPRPARKPRQRKPKDDGAPLPSQADLDRTREQSQLALKRKVRIFYDLQRLRLQTAGRTHRRPEGSPITLHETDVAVLDRRALELTLAEKHALADVAEHLGSIGFYRDVLSDKVAYRGIGPTMAGVILSEFDIYREEMPSSMWSFAGLAPVAALRCCSCHWVVEATDDGAFKHTGARARPGEAPEEPKKKRSCPSPLLREHVFESGRAVRPTRGEKLPYNAFLRTKLCGVLGPILIKVGSPWRKVYDGYKARKIAAQWGKSDGHRHAAAIRYMIKMLLLDIWTRWRTYEKLPVRPSYHEEKLGHTHHVRPERTAKAEAPAPPRMSIEEQRELELDAELALVDYEPTGT